jgi:hypothetical protein
LCDIKGLLRYGLQSLSPYFPAKYYRYVLVKVTKCKKKEYRRSINHLKKIPIVKSNSFVIESELEKETEVPSTSSKVTESTKSLKRNEIKVSPLKLRKKEGKPRFYQRRKINRSVD